MTELERLDARGRRLRAVLAAVLVPANAPEQSRAEVKLAFGAAAASAPGATSPPATP